MGLDSLGHQGTTAGHWGGREALAEAPSSSRRRGNRQQRGQSREEDWYCLNAFHIHHEAGNVWPTPPAIFAH